MTEQQENVIHEYESIIEAQHQALPPDLRARAEARWADHYHKKSLEQKLEHVELALAISRFCRAIPSDVRERWLAKGGVLHFTPIDPQHKVGDIITRNGHAFEYLGSGYWVGAVDARCPRAN